MSAPTLDEQAEMVLDVFEVQAIGADVALDLLALASGQPEHVAAFALIDAWHRRLDAANTRDDGTWT